MMMMLTLRWTCDQLSIPYEVDAQQEVAGLLCKSYTPSSGVCNSSNGLPDRHWHEDILSSAVCSVLQEYVISPPSL